MGFQLFHPTGYLGPTDAFHKYGTGPSPEYTVEDYEKQQATNPNTLPRTLPGSGRGLADLLKGIPRGSENRGGFTGVLEGKEGVDIDPDFFQSDFYKTYNDPKYTSGPQTMDMRFSKYFDVGGDQRFLDAAYDRFLKARDSGEPVQIPDPITQQPSNQNPFMGGFSRPPFMGGFGRSPFMGGFGRSPFMGGMFGSPLGGMMGGGYGSPFGGLGMFGMSPYGGYGGYGMFGGMMNPFMGGMGGMGGMFGRSGRGQMFQQPMMQQYPYQQQPTQQQPTQQQPTQNASYMGPNMNNSFMQNPFMGGLGSMFGNMFGGGMTQNASNQQSNVSQ